MSEFLKNITPREYQQKIFETCINKNCLVVLPTGLGKTLIALMLTIKRMQEYPGKKVVFLAPTKPLAEQHIIFSTPQCVANDLRKELYSLKDVCLLIEDEAHRCVKNYDYNYIAKRYITQADNPRIMGLTASPGNEASKIKEICKNLSIEEVELRTRDSPDVKKYLQTLFNQAAKKQSKGVVKLVANPEFNFIFMQSNELLAKKQEHPKLKELEEIIKKENQKRIIIFTQFRDTATIISEKLNKIEGIKSKIFVGQAKKEGTGLSQKDQKKIIEDFSAGEINVLVATSIAEEGLDIPEVNAVIFYEPIPSAIRAIQRAGRTARLKKGKLIMLITKGTRDESFYYVSKAREKQMHSAIETVKQGLTNNIKEEVQKTL